MRGMAMVGVSLLRQGAMPPRYQSDKAAGMDLVCESSAPRTLQPGERALFGTGIALEIPDGFEGQVRPRSGMAIKNGLTVLNSPGTIDSDYRGEVGVVLINLGQEPVTVSPGDRIAQLVIAPVAHAVMQVAERLRDTDRGAGGFGSTGK